MRGFTLIELLVALTITAMVFATLAGVLPSFLRTSEDLFSRIRNDDAVDGCLGVLRNDLRGADPRLLLGRSDAVKLESPNDRIALPTNHGLGPRRGMVTALYRLSREGPLLRAETRGLVMPEEDAWEPLLANVESLTLSPFPALRTRGGTSQGLEIRLLLRDKTERQLVVDYLLLAPGKVTKR